MNMVPTQNFTPEYEVNGLEKTETSNPKLARLMKAWEGKQTKAVRNISTLGLMAVGLSACGGSDDDNDDGDTDPTDPPVTGETVSLIIGDDNITGTDFADVFNALLASAEGSLTGVLGLQTLGDTDVINGGDGTDILNAVVNGTGLAIFDFAAPLITNVEIYNLTSRNGAGGLDLNNASGYTQLWNINSSGDLTLVNVEEAAALGLRGTEGGTTYSVEYTSSAAADIVEQLVIANGVGGSTLSGQFTKLDVAAPGDGIEDLTLQVSNGVRMILADAVADIEDLTIEGSGLLVLSADDSFDNLVSLTSTAYTGDLTLDVSGSTVLTSVETGAGDDFVNVNAAAVNGELSVDMGAGADTLSLASAFDEDSIEGLDFTGGVTGVETLSFEGVVALDDDTILNLDGISDDLEVIAFASNVEGNGNELALMNSPVDDLIINAVDIQGLELDAGNVVNLDVNVTGLNAALELDQVAGASLETLDLAQTNGVDGYIDLGITSDADNDVSALQSITATAAGDAVVDLDADDQTADMGALSSVAVAAAADAELYMTGFEGIPTAAVSGGFDFTISGEFDDPGIGPVNDRTVTIELDGKEPIVLDLGDGDSNTQTTANLIAAALNTRPDIASATVTAAGGGNFQISVFWTEGAETAGNVTDVTFDSDPDGFTADEVPSLVDFNTYTVLTDGVAATGFNALEDATVTADVDATVDLEDVYGAFVLDVTAGEDADVTLSTTGATEVNVTVGSDVVYQTNMSDEINDYDDIDTADIEISGDNADLVSLNVVGAQADVTLEDDLSGMTTIDLTGVSVEFDVDASAAVFEPSAGDYVSYLIGATESDWENGDSSIEMADARESVVFTQADFGTVVLNGFTDGADPATGDRIDLSQLGFTNNGQLLFEEGTYGGDGVFTAGGGNDIRISDLAGGPEMSGKIIVTGLSDADDLSQFNMTYV